MILASRTKKLLAQLSVNHVVIHAVRMNDVLILRRLRLLVILTASNDHCAHLQCFVQAV